MENPLAPIPPPTRLPREVCSNAGAVTRPTTRTKSFSEEGGRDVQSVPRAHGMASGRQARRLVCSDTWGCLTGSTPALQYPHKTMYDQYGPGLRQVPQGGIRGTLNGAILDRRTKRETSNNSAVFPPEFPEHRKSPARPLQAFSRKQHTHTPARAFSGVGGSNRQLLSLPGLLVVTFPLQARLSEGPVVALPRRHRMTICTTSVVVVVVVIKGTLLTLQLVGAVLGSTAGTSRRREDGLDFYWWTGRRRMVSNLDDPCDSGG